MRFYVAGRLTNDERVSRMIRALEAEGHECAYDWTAHGSLQHDPSRWPEVAEKELQGVIDSDFVIVFPGARGTHVELGAALTLRTPVALIGTEAEFRVGYEYDCIFHYHPLVQRVPRPELVVEWVRGLQ